jgi:predicted ester cyclase
VEPVTERNKQRLRKFVESVLNEGRMELIEELVAADFIGHVTGGSSPVVGPAAMRRLVSTGRSAYTDLQIKIDDQIAEEDRVVVRWRATGTPAGTSSSPSAEGARCTGVSIVRFLAGKLVDAQVDCPPVPFEWVGFNARDPGGRQPYEPSAG